MKGCSRFGQMRILEAVVASILIYIAFTAVFYMLFSSEKSFKYEVVDLERLAHNVLHRLVESDVIEETLTSTQGSETKLIIALQGLLPQNVFFNLTIYEVDRVGSRNRMITVSNAPKGVFKVANEVASASTLYTSRWGGIYLLYLSLTRVGGL